MPPGVLQCPEAEQARPEQFLGLQPKAKLDPGMKAILVEVLIQTVSSEKLLVVTAELRELSQSLDLLSLLLSPVSAKQVYHCFMCPLCDLQHTALVFS